MTVIKPGKGLPGTQTQSLYRTVGGADARAIDRVSEGGSVLLPRVSSPSDPIYISAGNLIDHWTAHSDYMSLTGSAIEQWVGAYAGLAFTQGTAALKPAYNSSGFGTANYGSVELDGTDDYMISAIAKTLTNCLHDGTGGMVMGVYEVDTAAVGTFLETSNAAASNGARYFTRNTGAIQTVIGPSILNVTTTSTFMYTGGGSAYWFACTFSSAALNWYASGGISETNTTGWSPTAADSAINLQLGDSAVKGVGRYSDILAYSAVHDEATVREIAAYFAALRGATA